MPLRAVNQVPLARLKVTRKVLNNIKKYLGETVVAYGVVSVKMTPVKRFWGLKLWMIKLLGR